MKRSETTVKFRDSVGFRYLTVAIIALVIIQLLFAGFQTYRQYQADRQDLDAKVEETAVLLSAVSPEAMLGLDWLTLETLMRQTTANEDIVYSVIVDSSGRPLTNYLDRENEFIAEARKSNTSILDVTTAVQKERLIHEKVVPITFQGDILGEVRIGYSLQQVEDNAIAASVTTLATTFFTILLLALVSILYFNRLIRRPLAKLVDLSGNLAGGNLNARASFKRADEIAQLGGSFNRMAIQLQDLISGLESKVQERTAELDNRVQDLRTLQTTGLELASHQTNLNQVLQVATTSLKDLIDIDLAGIFLWDADNKDLKLAEYYHKTGADLSNYTPTLESDINYIAFSQKQIQTRLNTANSNSEDIAWAKDMNVHSIISVPLLWQDEAIGVMFAGTSDATRTFDESTERLMSLYAQQSTTIIVNAQLYEVAERARQEAEDANKIKSRFLANMSHELRTPLNAILNFTAFVKDGDFGDVNEDQVDALEQSYSSGKHLLALINDVLDLTKIESGLMDLFVQEVDFNEMLNVVVSVTKGLIKEKPVNLHTNIADDLPKSFGDKRRLRQVFLNLVSNAVKFTPQGDLTISAEYRNDKIHIEVRDSGIGIAPEDHGLVFDTFKQAKHNISESIGTGLGLPISKFFVESHGGQIWLESAVDQGTTFFVELPLLLEQEAHAISKSIQVGVA